MLPPLFKKENNKTRFWKITLDLHSSYVSVFTEYGLSSGKIRKTEPTIFYDSQQKTALQLATTFAQAQWRKRRREGYKPLTADSYNDIILPMSAVPLEKYSSKIRYPAWIQPKLDGYRCLARKKNQVIELRSKRGLLFPYLDQIKKALEPWFKLHPHHYLDGELYLPGGFPRDIQRVLGRKELDTPSLALEKKIEYHIFDTFHHLEEPFGGRHRFLQKNLRPTSRIHLVPTHKIHSPEEIDTYKQTYLKEGLEGVIVRNDAGTYRSGKKSMDVLRSKEFYRARFTIVGAIEGRGENKDTVIWVVKCHHDPQKTFLARPMGTREERKTWWKNRKDYIGKQLEVKYVEIDKKTGCVSRFPIGIKIV